MTDAPTLPMRATILISTNLFAKDVITCRYSSMENQVDEHDVAVHGFWRPLKHHVINHTRMTILAHFARRLNLHKHTHKPVCVICPPYTMMMTLRAYGDAR